MNSSHINPMYTFVRITISHHCNTLISKQRSLLGKKIVAPIHQKIQKKNHSVSIYFVETFVVVSGIVVYDKYLSDVLTLFHALVTFVLLFHKIQFHLHSSHLHPVRITHFPVCRT